jgi:hypothetical protein
LRQTERRPKPGPRDLASAQWLGHEGELCEAFRGSAPIAQCRVVDKEHRGAFSPKGSRRVDPTEVDRARSPLQEPRGSEDGARRKWRAKHWQRVDSGKPESDGTRFFREDVIGNSGHGAWEAPFDGRKSSRMAREVAVRLQNRPEPTGSPKRERSRHRPVDIAKRVSIAMGNSGQTRAVTVK